MLAFIGLVVLGTQAQAQAQVATQAINDATVTAVGVTETNPNNNAAKDADPIVRTTVTVTKISNGGTDTFGFSGNNGIAAHNIVTTATGAPGTAGVQQTLTAAATATAITENVPPAGWVLSNAACTVTPPGGTAAPAAGTFDAASRTFNLTAADTAAGNAIACTFTNQRPPSLQLAKAWAAGSTAGHQVSIGATTGGANNTVAFGATAPNAADSGTPVVVSIGDTITLPAEAGTNVANYATALACTGGHTLSGSDGQQVNTLTITSANAAVCTYTNTLRTTDLSITKTNTPAAGPSDQGNDTVTRGPTTYTLVVRNNGPITVTGAVVTDMPGPGITCPGANVVSIDYSGATPDTTSTIATLTSAGGIVLGQLGVNQTATLMFNCTVN